MHQLGRPVASLATSPSFSPSSRPRWERYDLISKQAPLSMKISLKRREIERFQRFAKSELVRQRPNMP
jgi:hypothetical protein